MTNFPVDTNDVEETDLVPAGPIKLNTESAALIEKIIAESDEQKVKELTQLFNANQNKKTMARVNKLSDLLDTITDQALTRFTSRPDEISNKELMDGLKIVQDLIERGQRQAAGVEMTPPPLIQVNQQTVNIGESGANSLNRDSRERVKNAVMDLLKGLNQNTTNTVEADFIDIESPTMEEEDNDE